MDYAKKLRYLIFLFNFKWYHIVSFNQDIVYKFFDSLHTEKILLASKHILPMLFKFVLHMLQILKRNDRNPKVITQ